MQTKAIRYSQHMPAAELNKNEKLDLCWEEKILLLLLISGKYYNSTASFNAWQRESINLLHTTAPNFWLE